MHTVCKRHTHIYTHIFHLHKLRSYWTKVHQIHLEYSQIIADKLFKITMVTLQSVSECQNDE